MSATDTISIGASIIAFIGGGGVIVFALSNWLGKFWANRLMQEECQKHALELEHLRDSLRTASKNQLASLQLQLDVAKEARVREHLDRVTIYRMAIDLFTEIAAKVEILMLKKKSALSTEELYEFEVQRLRVYGYLACTLHNP